jgi:hypothetical protein
MMLGLCFWTCVAYVDFAADMISTTVDAAIGGAVGKGLWLGRSFLVTGLIWMLILPLASLRDLAALAPFSAVGVAASAYVALFVSRRSLDGTYGPGGLYAEAHVKRPQEVNSVGDDTAESLVSFVAKSIKFAATAAVGFLSHYNAGDYFKSLTDATPRRFAVVSGSAFLLTAAAYATVMAAATNTFSPETLMANPSLLSCYNGTGDTAADIGRLGLSLAIITSFPLMFAGLRRSVMAVAGSVFFEQCSLLSAGSDVDAAEQLVTAEQRASRRHTNSTVLLLVWIHLAVLAIPDVGILVSVLGALFGSCVMFALPGVLAIAHLKQGEQVGSDDDEGSLLEGALGGSDGSAILPLEEAPVLLSAANLTTARGLAKLIAKIKGRVCGNLAALRSLEAILPNLSDIRTGKGKVSGVSRFVYWLLIGIAAMLAVTGFPYEAFNGTVETL